MQDIFICGICQNSFNELDQFILHKQTPCQAVQDDPQAADVNQGQGQFESTDLESNQYGSSDQGQQFEQRIDPGEIIMGQITEQIRNQGQLTSVEGQTFEVQGQTFVAQTFENRGQTFEAQNQNFQTQTFVQQTQSFAETKQFAQNPSYEVDFGEGNLQVALHEAEESGVLAMVEEDMGTVTEGMMANAGKTGEEQGENGRGY